MPEHSNPAPVDALRPEAIEASVAQALAAFAGAETVAALKDARLAHTGDKSLLALANRAIGSIPQQDRKEVGRLLGAARGRVQQALAERTAAVETAELTRSLAEEAVDVTLPVQLTPEGAIHPVTALIDRMCDIFVAMGWSVAEGPELEHEWFNFDALNIGPDHPSRGESDTLFVEPASSHLVMRTHTSPVQIRSLLERPLPVYVVCPGKVYRADEYDATHLPVFHQIEGLVVDRGISMAHLRGALDQFAQLMFGAGIRTRMRPHYFPFTEPSAEVDLECFVCRGASVGNPDRPCRTCKSEGWIEWGGCGVVNPRVLAACGVDTEVYTGFAFGMGIDRTLQTRNSANNMRDFVEGDVRFSRTLKGVAR
jgi:phenylalanyl-tRNA synthetase alpha chain